MSCPGLEGCPAAEFGDSAEQRHLRKGRQSPADAKKHADTVQRTFGRKGYCGRRNNPQASTPAAPLPSLPPVTSRP